MFQTRVGISGWTYGPWRGVFYPKDLPHKRELEWASRQFNSIEINGSFYSLQRPSSFQSWHDATPDDFAFSVKGGRFITHMKKLKDVETPLANFFASGLLKLRQKLGPILWQFPPGFALNENRFRDFFELLPKSTSDAAKFARKHDERLEGRSWTKTDADRPIRYAVEIRHNSFKDERFIKLLKRYNVALVLADTAGRWPYMEDVTADFIYARLHGDEELYVSGYTDSALDWWAARLRAWQCGEEPPDPLKVIPNGRPRKCKGRDVYVYFDNDAKVKAPFDALRLAARLAGREDPESPEDLPKHAGEPARDRWPGIRNRPAARPKPATRPTRRTTRGER
jgi:uncharacterized protein YecE (DUF72 family)